MWNEQLVKDRVNGALQEGEASQSASRARKNNRQPFILVRLFQKLWTQRSRGDQSEDPQSQSVHTRSPAPESNT